VTVNERFGLVFAKTGSINLACSCAHRAQLNFGDLTPYIVPKKTDKKHKSAWVQAVGWSTQHNKSITRKGQWHEMLLWRFHHIYETHFLNFGQQLAEIGEYSCIALFQYANVPIFIYLFYPE
jgi:hypothetical protein